MHRFLPPPRGTVNPPWQGGREGVGAPLPLHICLGAGSQLFLNPQWARIRVWGGSHPQGQMAQLLSAQEQELSLSARTCLLTHMDR